MTRMRLKNSGRSSSFNIVAVNHESKLAGGIFEISQSWKFVKSIMKFADLSTPLSLVNFLLPKFISHYFYQQTTQLIN